MQLCERPLGATDYLAVARVFHYVIIRNLPPLGRDNLSAARRFITLIDTLYDHKVRYASPHFAARQQCARALKVRVAMSAALPLEELFMLADDEPRELSDTQRALMDDLQLTAGDVS